MSSQIFQKKSKMNKIGYGKPIGICLPEMPGVEIIEINIEVEHIHMVIVTPPKYAVSEVLVMIKGSSFSMLSKKFAWLGKVYRKENIVCSPGYFMSTIGLNEKQIIT